jgi:signal transduction histidine kinase
MGESSQRSASYSFVPPGNYEFQVRACNGDGVWNETGAAVKFTVRPYFWQTWWFKVALALLAGVVLWMIFAIRLARVRALQRERLRIARDLHDEVGAGLGTIALLGEFIEQHPTASDGQEVRQMALQTIDSLRDIIWFIDPSFDRMDHLVARLQAIAKARLPGFELNFRSSSDFKRTPLPLTFRRNMIPLFKEALHNILKHACARRVEIQVRNERNEFKLTISDNGSGFDPGKPVDGNGLKNMHRRAGEMNGRLEILRPPAGGTTLRLTVPLP